jgi:hypothetical protein
MGAERRRLLLYLALLGVTAGLLGSCAAERPRPPQTSAARPLPQPPPENAVRPQPVPRPGRKPAPPVPSDSADLAGTAQSVAITAPTALLPPAPPPTPPPAPSSASPEQSGPRSPKTSELIGLDQPAAMRLLGPAAERSDEPPATVWRYKTASCELDLFFYLDLQSGKMRTLHYALRGADADTNRRQDCLRSLATTRGG